jgi:hypothetical protein
MKPTSKSALLTLCLVLFASAALADTYYRTGQSSQAQGAYPQVRTARMEIRNALPSPTETDVSAAGVSYLSDLAQDDTPYSDVVDSACGADTGCDSCDPGDDDDNGREIFGFQLGGWLDQGFSAVANNPADRFNGVVGLNDRQAEYQMNQLWLYLSRETDTGGCGWDIGGRVDVVYGTDAQAWQCYDGLEASWDQTERFYQVAVPQFYLDVAYNDFTLTVGHFITPLGYEEVMAPENFFYSLSYSYMYGVPGTHFGMMGTWDVNDNWAVFAGIHRGGDQFDDTDGKNAVNFLGGVSWINDDEDTWVDFTIDAEEKGPDNPTTYLTLVGGTSLTKRIDWVIEYTWGEEAGNDAEWYGINQHFYYEINPCWSAGLRVEWFRDDDGFVVAGLRDGNLAQGPFVGNFYEVTLGLLWQPRERLMVRPEVRWDWYDEDEPGTPLPFDAGDRSSQALFGIDVITTF